MNFETTKEDGKLILKIAKRARDMYPQVQTTLDWSMDLTACHVNGAPLRLDDLLAADDFNFAHDVLGIRRHINRETGKLENHFLPRHYSPRVNAQTAA